MPSPDRLTSRQVLDQCSKPGIHRSRSTTCPNNTLLSAGSTATATRMFRILRVAVGLRHRGATTAFPPNLFAWTIRPQRPQQVALRTGVFGPRTCERMRALSEWPSWSSFSFGRLSARLVRDDDAGHD